MKHTRSEAACISCASYCSPKSWYIKLYKNIILSFHNDLFHSEYQYAPTISYSGLQ